MDHIEKRHPQKPRWYLQAIGTDPTNQGKGFEVIGEIKLPGGPTTARTGLTSPPSARSRPAEQRARIGQSRLEG